MFRPAPLVVLCLGLGGCVTNNLSTQNAQLTPVNTPVVQRPAVPQAPPMSQGARLAAAKMISLDKTVMAGQSLSLSKFSSLKKDCTQDGDISVKVLTQPEHGAVQVNQVMAFSEYEPGDPHFQCNNKKAPMTEITYRAQAGYAGDDTIVLQVFFPSGNAPTILYRLSVR